MPQNVFLIIAIVFGISFQLITPPFQSPDEFNHFYRAYQISKGQFTPVNHDKRLGGFVPESFIDIQDIFITQRYSIFYTINKAEIKEKESIPLDENKQVFIDFPNTALYSPMSYLPQSFAIFISRKLSFTPINVFYFARFITFLFWLIYIYLSIRLIPIYKWLLAFLALLPLGLFINSTLSADVVTNCLAFITISFVLHCAFKIERFTYKHLAILVSLAVLLSLSKLIYASLIILFFIIPVNKFKNRTEWFLFFLIILIFSVSTAMAWTNIIFDHYIPYPSYNHNFGQNLDLPILANITQHKAYIFNDPVYFLKILHRTFIYSTVIYIPSYIGALGSLEVDPPTWCFYLCYVLIFFVAFFETNDHYKLGYRQKIIIVVYIFSAFTLLVYSQLISFDFIGVFKVDMLQGRYLIPVYPMAFMLLNQSRFKINKSYFVLPFVCICIVLYLSYKALGERYVYHANKQVTNIIWNANVPHDINADKEFKKISNSYSTRSLNLSDITSYSQDVLYNGASTLKMYNKVAYACNYTLPDAKKGDVIYAEMMIKGKGAHIIIAADTLDKPFVGSGLPLYQDENGWRKVRMYYDLVSDYGKNHAQVFLWNSSQKDTAYIANFKVKISRIN